MLFSLLTMYNKKLSHLVFVLCGIINASVRVICLTFGSADNSYLDIDKEGINSRRVTKTICQSKN